MKGLGGGSSASFEDVAAVVDSPDRPAALFGHSYGATVSLGAALVTEKISRLILYEPAFGFASASSGDIERIEEVVAAAEREEALVHALRAFGLTPAELEQSRAAPTWQARVAAAHTVAREICAEEAYAIDRERLRRLDAPTLLLLGEESPDWAREGTERIHAAPRFEDRPSARSGHAAIVTAPALVAEEVTRFLSDMASLSTPIDE